MTPTEAALGLREWFEVFRRRGKGNEPTVKEFLEAADLIEKLDKRVPRWISVEERLPEELQYVLAIDQYDDDSFEPCIAYVRAMQWFHGNFMGGEITHWMPLPEPPKEDA